ncbi:MAG: N-6 DNA methylase [Thermodesulfovibrionales bacterium]|nr:N-6 DNA methylase [Thermodesulfovibrionales bacterium]
MKTIYKTYLQTINTLYSSREAREESYYPALKDFLETSFGDFISIIAQPKKNIAGIPDFLIKDKSQKLIGYIEAKHPDEKDLYGIAESEQLKRYRESLPNLILTNFLEFHLYRDGKLIDAVRLTDAKSLFIEVKIPKSIKNLEVVKLLFEKFLSFSIPAITTSKVLAIELAKKTRLLQFLISEEIKEGNADLRGFYEAFKNNLMPSLTEEKFSDMYSQTIAYGLFSSRMRFHNPPIPPLAKGGKGGFSEQKFSRLTAYQNIPSTIPLLKSLFYFLTGPNLPQSIEWIVDDIASVLENTDIVAIHKELHTERWIDDPVIHFYETFLSVYNPSEREKLGVYYTPPPVVSFIVKSVNNLLKEKFGKAEGLADSTVIILDPASGTMTFPTLAIKLIKNELDLSGKTGIFPSLVKEHVLKNFYAFEFLIAPYVIGHFKASLVLEDMGYSLSAKERFNFFLTNTLDMEIPKQGSFLIDLAKEGELAHKVKEEVPVLVIMGNPPYSVSSDNKSPFIEELMEDYKRDVKDERNIQPLSDDYIKFLRFAQWKIEKTGKGIVGFITNNSYLSGLIHRGMRKRLFNSFDEIYILNLHGNSRTGEKPPNGVTDENVFNIQQGVAIGLFVKL